MGGHYGWRKAAVMAAAPAGVRNSWGAPAQEGSHGGRLMIAVMLCRADGCDMGQAELGVSYGTYEECSAAMMKRSALLNDIVERYPRKAAGRHHLPPLSAARHGREAAARAPPASDTAERKADAHPTRRAAGPTSLGEPTRQPECKSLSAIRLARPGSRRCTISSSRFYIANGG
jgi:hypothetical protein